MTDDGWGVDDDEWRKASFEIIFNIDESGRMESVNGFLKRFLFLAYSQVHHFEVSKASYPFYVSFFSLNSRSRSQYWHGGTAYLT